MKMLKKRNKWMFILMWIYLLFILPYPGMLKGADLPSATDVAFGKAQLPTIEQLTGGKVKTGDLIDKSNMDLVKEFLTVGQIELLNQGMKMVMDNHKMKPFEGVFPAFVELTEKNRGKAVLDEETITAWYEKEGQLWPGGDPYPEPTTANQVMANVKFGVVNDDFHMEGVMELVNKDVKFYNTTGYWGVFIWTNCRVNPPHVLEGYEDQMYRSVSCFTTPTEAKGLGGFNIRYYNDTKKYDQGFYYHPAFKKTGRSNATTWMNNAGGTDFTYGDAMALRDPFSDWSFKYLGTKYVLHPVQGIGSLLDENQKPIKEIVYDYGKKYPRFRHAVLPWHVIEATPKIRHVYGMKMLYVFPYRYARAGDRIPMMDAYDTQMKIWKQYLNFPSVYLKDLHCAQDQGSAMWDMQSKHSTTYWYKQLPNQGFGPRAASLKALWSKGR
jgi:hypothetical protein